MKKYIIIILTVIITLNTFSCSNDEIKKEDQLSLNQKFDYTFFEYNKNTFMDMNVLKSIKADKKIKNTAILDYINTLFGEEPVLNEFAYEYFNYNSDEMREKALKDGVFTNIDIQLMDSFVSDIENNTFDIALSNLESNVINLHLSNDDFYKYNAFTNEMKLVNYQTDLFTSTFAKGTYQNKSLSWACAIAVANYTLSTVAVGAGCVPEPAAPLACPLAVGYAVIAYANMLETCTR